MEKKEAAFAKNRERLTKKIEEGNPGINVVIRDIRTQLQGIKENINKIYNPQPIRKMKVELKDLPNFGTKLTDNSRNFRWTPTIEQL